MKQLLTITLCILTIGVFGQPNDTLFYQNSNNIKRIINWGDSLEYYFYNSGESEAVYRLVSRNEMTSIDAFHLESKEWFENGVLKMENTKSQDTLIHAEYFENGKLEFRSKKVPEVNAAFNFIFQSWGKYCDNGQPKSCIELPTKLDTGFEEFHCNGNLAISSDSTDSFGGAYGTIRHFDENGSLSEIWKTTSISRVQQRLIWIKRFDQKGKLNETEYFDKNGEKIMTEK